MNLFWHKRKRVAKDPYDETEITVVHKDEVGPVTITRLIMAGLFLLLAFGTIGQQLYWEGQRNSDRDKQAAVDEKFRHDQEDLNTRLQEQINQVNADRERLRGLIIGILTAPTPEQRRKLLEEFTKSEITPPGERPRPSPTPQRSSRNRPEPAPTPQDSPSPRPKPSQTAKPSPSPSPCTIRLPVTGRCVVLERKP